MKCPNYDEVHRYEGQLFELAEWALPMHIRYRVLKITAATIPTVWILIRLFAPRLNILETFAYDVVLTTALSAYLSAHITAAVPFKGWWMTRRNEGTARHLARARARTPRPVRIDLTTIQRTPTP